MEKMARTPSHAPSKLTPAWRAVGLLATLLLAFDARAEEPGYGPNGAASADELYKLREEMQAAARDQAARTKGQDEQIARLQQQLDEEWQRRVESEARARDAALAAAERVNDPLLVRARNFGLALTGFVQVDAVAWRQSSEDEINPATENPLNETR